jgi:uncharacterized membrane protein
MANRRTRTADSGHQPATAFVRKSTEPNGVRPDAPTFPSHIEDAIRSIAQLDIDHHDSATPPQRWVVGATDLLGRPWFLGAATVSILAWMTLNGLAPLVGARPVDPAPFMGLSTGLSLGSFFVVMLILITQRHDDRLARHQARLDLQLTLQSEQKTAKMISLLEELRRDTPIVRDRVDAEAEAMAETADPGKLLHALKQVDIDTSRKRARRGRDDA